MKNFFDFFQKKRHILDIFVLRFFDCSIVYAQKCYIVVVEVVEIAVNEISH